jgi:hypothetical protein
MESEHISNRRLCEVVAEEAVLDQSEIEHLKQCEECLEVVRLFVRQRLSKPANHSAGV